MNDYTLYLGAESYEAFRSAFIKDAEEWANENLKYKSKSTKIMEGNKLDIQVTDRNRSYGDSRVYRYLINGESALRFDQIPYPECCGIAIIKNFSANSDISKVDFIDAINKFIVDMQENDAFSKVLFYTNAGSNGDRLFSQIPDVVVLDPFKNMRSGNTLVGFEIDLLGKESTREGWRSLDLGEDDFDDDEAAEEHDEEEDNDTFGLMPDILPQQTQSEQLNARSTITVGRGILDRIQSGGMPHFANPFPTGRTIEATTTGAWYDPSF